MTDTWTLADDPFDHNAECRFCDEQAGHAADCPWLLAQLEELQQLRVEVERLRERLKQLPGRIAELQREVEGNALMHRMLDDVANDRAKQRKP